MSLRTDAIVVIDCDVLVAQRAVLACGPPLLRMKPTAACASR